MNIAIIEDSPADRKQLWEDIKKCATENALFIHATAFENGEDFFKQGALGLFDVVFLDIYMQQLDGMAVAERIRASNPACKIVFVSASAAYAVKSYEVRAFYYILKPYTYEELVKVIGMLDKSLQKSSCYLKVKEGREWYKIFLADILYVDYSNHYVQIHTEDSITSTYMKFAEIEEKLSSYPDFLNCYRCILINMNKIQKIDELFFLLDNGEYIPINRKRAKEVNAQYMDYIFGIIEG